MQRRKKLHQHQQWGRCVWNKLCSPDLRFTWALIFDWTVRHLPWALTSDWTVRRLSWALTSDWMVRRLSWALTSFWTVRRLTWALTSDWTVRHFTGFRTSLKNTSLVFYHYWSSLCLDALSDWLFGWRNDWLMKIMRKQWGNFCCLKHKLNKKLNIVATVCFFIYLFIILLFVC